MVTSYNTNCKNKFRDVNSISPIKSDELQVELKTTNTKAERLKGDWGENLGLEWDVSS